LVVTISFLTLLTAIGGVGAFFLFGFLTLVALAYFWRRVPETNGRSLQDSSARSKRSLTFGLYGGRNAKDLD
jgi:hypothetical protein